MEDLILAMKQPEFYPHKVDKHITEISTHISNVFLTGDFVYKIKKGLDLGFLDFSTLKKREYFIREELRLNRRFSKSLYLEVVPIYFEKTRGFFLGPQREELTPVEWALKMRQFPQWALFSNLLEENKLTQHHLQDLGHNLADFHQKAQRAGEDNDYGTAKSYLQIIEQNEDSLKESHEPFLEKNKLWQIIENQKQFLLEYQKLFQRRKKEGRIRECHGDLHLKNIVFYEKKACPFDCIEFNDAFKFIDVFYDCAFLFMDLIKNKREDLAYEFMNDYLEVTGDYRGVKVLNFLGSIRAFIRGKVDLLKLKYTPQALVPTVTQEVNNYFQTSFDLSRERSGFVLCFSGVSGTGKSYLSQGLSSLVGAIRIRSDVIRKHMFKIPLYKKGPESLYSSSNSRKVYQELVQLAVDTALSAGPVFLDAKFDRKDQREQLQKKCHEKGLKVGFVHCQAPREVLEKRIERRFHDVSDAGVELLDRQIESFEKYEKADYTLILDTTKPWDKLIQEVLEFIVPLR
jgi:aminoglycoside phosphotransferase family enzyme/predicted kinase